MLKFQKEMIFINLMKNKCKSSMMYIKKNNISQLYFNNIKKLNMENSNQN